MNTRYRFFTNKTAVTICAVLALLAVATVGTSFVWAKDRGNTVLGRLEKIVATRETAAVNRTEALRLANAMSEAFANAAETIRPSVVSIRSVKHLKESLHFGHGQPTMPDFPFDEDFLRRFFGGHLPEQMPPQQGVGSGVIVDSDGYVLTNNHVVDGADEVMVRLTTGNEYKAKIVGTDPLSDLAVIRIKADDLHPAQLGDSNRLRVGEWVVAAGCPFGLNGTITAGIVSAKGRSNMRIAEYEDFIQTDAAINPGNSGGPLIDLNGNVVGINTAIASHTGGNNGVGFAIPINMAKTIMGHLIHEGKVIRGWLGIAIQPLDEHLAKSFGYESKEGVLISDAMADGPAAKAGLKAGDVVTRYEGHKVKDTVHFRNLVAATDPGTSVKMEIYRDGKPKTFSVTVGTLKPEELAAARGETPEEKTGELGMTVTNPTAETRGEYSLPANASGALVTEVQPGSVAELGGIRAGDLIVEVQGKPVSNVQEYRREIGQHELKNGIRLLVQTGEMKHFVMLWESGE